MSLDFLPPQAYTKETLLKAYTWLQDQSEQIRELATTPDQLVSLYLKATRHGQETVERPSLQNFKSELKNLAGMMGDLDKKQTPVPASNSPQTQLQMTPIQPPLTTSQSSNHHTTFSQAAFTQLTHSQATFAQATTSQSAYTQQGLNTGGAHSQPPASPPMPTAPSSSQPLSEPAFSTPKQVSSNDLMLDETTQSLIQEVKNELNLSSDYEVLRMLIKIGYQKVRSLYK